MDPNRLKELQDLANQKKENDALLKIKNKEHLSGINDLERKFKSKFGILKNEVFKPFAKESIATGLNIKFLSDDTSKNFDDQIRVFFSLLFNKHPESTNFTEKNTLFIIFEGFPRKNTIEINRKTSITYPEIEKLGEFSIDSISNDTLEEFMLDFIRQVLK